MPKMPMEPTDEMKEQAVREADERLKAQKEQQAEEQRKAQKAIKPGQTRPTAFMAAGLTAEELEKMMPQYADIGPKPFGIGPKRWKWSWKKHKERRKLRKDLKKNYNIKKWRDFEEIAREVGLGIDNPILLWLLRFFGFMLGKGGILTILGACTLFLLGLFAWSFIQEQVGSFTIQLNPKTMKAGFVLSDTPDFSYKTARLKSDELLRVNAISVEDIVKDVDVEADGAHNGKFYVAYTFYIRNEGDYAQGYEYSLVMQDSTRQLENALWIMLYEDGHQIIYTMPNARDEEESGTQNEKEVRPERLAGYSQAPFFDTAYACEDQYYFYCKDAGGYVTDGTGAKVKFSMDANGTVSIREGDVPESKREAMIRSAESEWVKEWGVCTTPTIDTNIVTYGIVEDVQPGEAHKYTVVIWVEGDDPECTDELFGGFAKYYMEFDPIDEGKRSLFDTIYRKEYEVINPDAEDQQKPPSDDRTENTVP